MNKQLEGAITALVTPFDEQGNVDIASLKRLVRIQIDAIVPCGSTGETATMNEKNKQTLTYILQKHKLV